ncbi:MAG: hypothetical protein AAGD96_27350, partial [Chloroflexota bacterium]
MINVILRGDMGNQLFQYAVGRKLALIHQSDLTLHTANRHSIFDPTGSRLKHKLRLFHLKARFDHRPFLWSRLRLQKFTSSPMIHQETGWGFTPEVLALPDNCYLFGYFQSEKYFKDLAPILRHEFE